MRSVDRWTAPPPSLPTQIGNAVRWHNINLCRNGRIIDAIEKRDENDEVLEIAASKPSS